VATPSVTYSFASGALASAAEVNTNFSDLVTFLQNDVIHKDGSVAFTGAPTYASDPASGNQLARKTYVDNRASKVLQLKTAADGVIAASAATGTFYNWTDSTLSAQSLTSGIYYELEGFVPNVFGSTGTGLPYTVSLGLFDGSTRLQTRDQLQTTAGTGGGLYVKHRWLQGSTTSKTFSMRVAQYSGTTTAINISGSAEKFPYLTLTWLGKP